MRFIALLFLLISTPLRADCPASATAFTGARHDAPFFVFDGGSRGEGFGQFDSPSAIAEIGSGLLAISDTRNHRIKTVTLEGFFQDFWWGNEGTKPGDFRFPGAIAPVGDGSVWIVDGGNHRVLRLQAIKELVADLTGTHLKTIGGRGSGKGKFENPTGAAVDPRGRLFVVDSGNRRIQVFSDKGKFLEAWSDPTFEKPYGIVIDSTGTLYVTDSARHQVLKLEAAGRRLGAWGAHGTGDGQLDTPRGLAVRDGFVYVADSGNARVVKFDVGGKFIATVGCRGNKVGELDDPVSVIVDSEHHLYVVDRGNHRVQKLGHQ